MQIGVGQPKEVDQRRVIVVDDDEITRAALQFMLHEEIETHRACNAGRGLCHGRRLAKTASGVARRRFLSKRGGADRRTGAPFPDDRILIISDRSDQIRAFVEHHNHIRFHESIDNLTPADGTSAGLRPILAKRKRVKRNSIIKRRSQHQLQATLTPDEPKPPFSKSLISLKLSDDGQRERSFALARRSAARRAVGSNGVDDRAA
ncbi:hypothetical protein [Bradyrhizobium paxllaeri]|uniref:hypothetical protein n=1 Tax=Bradyrhizobium paxllaeri TaxID=190148 RepID=UPI001652B6FD|nr:hypothetical protein [Bradyrhizobium paxllaeri]